MRVNSRAYQTTLSDTRIVIHIVYGNCIEILKCMQRRNIAFVKHVMAILLQDKDKDNY